MLIRFSVNKQDVKYYRVGYHAFAHGQSRDLGADLPVEYRKAFFCGWDAAHKRGYALSNIVTEVTVMEVAKSLHRMKLD